ncbi:MAG: VTC domain-containing protein [Anaerolineales bacterium]|nr:VTC domain-containing protein [Chloroflexota bacterium]MBL6983452.1 VTC domain-containing protein [Anaerolineales bacterium]
MNNSPIREFRYERKFFVDQLDAKQAIALIKQHPAMFTEIYPPRYINNIYMDDPWMENFFDNVDGATERKKARVRWYHNLFRQVDDPLLEFKIKRGLVGTKAQYPFPPFAFDETFTERSFKDAIRKSNLPVDVRSVLLAIEPVLCNRYLRWYFATPDRKFRVTIDTGLTFYHINKLTNRFLYKQVDYDDIVVELKYQSEDDPEASRITGGFPFRVTRSSKYVQGIERVYL